MDTVVFAIDLIANAFVEVSLSGTMGGKVLGYLNASCYVICALQFTEICNII